MTTELHEGGSGNKRYTDCHTALRVAKNYTKGYTDTQVSYTTPELERELGRGLTRYRPKCAMRRRMIHGVLPVPR